MSASFLEKSMDRRKFFAFTAGAGLTAAGLAKAEAANAVEYKRDEGIWTTEQIQLLANSMRGRLGLPFVIDAGLMLQEGLVGKKMYEGSDYLTDQFDEQGNALLPSIENGKIDDSSSFSSSQYVRAGEVVKIRTQQKDGSLALIDESSKVAVPGIILDTNRIKKMSDFGVEFSIAVELERFRTFDKLMHFLELTYPNLPANENERRAVLINAYDINRNYTVFDAVGNTLTTTAKVMFSWWSVFESIPDYLKAKDLSRFGQEDINILAPQRQSIQDFVTRNALKKDENGNYYWTVQNKALYDQWQLSVGQTIYRKLQTPLPIKPLSPQGGPLIVPKRPEIKPS